MRLFLSLLLSALLVSAIGCAEKTPADMPKLYPVKVEIKQGNAPVEGAVVTLSGGANPNWPAVGTTNAKGVVDTFYTNALYKGVPEGKFKMTVRKTEKVYKDDPATIPPKPTDPQEAYAWRTKYVDNAPPPDLYDLINQDYLDNATSPVELEVKPGKNQFSFDVGAPVRILLERPSI